jgi:hypothetical protein
MPADQHTQDDQRGQLQNGILRKGNVPVQHGEPFM